MNYKALWLFLTTMFSSTAFAQWQAVNNVDYTWGPFKIYNISLSTETGDYQTDTRPVMLTLTYSKPVDGRDFAISVARSWKSLGISLFHQEDVIDKFRKILPDLKPNDKLHYISLADRGYFVLNDQVIDQIFPAEFNDAMLAIWLDPSVELSSKLTAKKQVGATQEVHHSVAYSEHSKEIAITPQKEPETADVNAEQAVDSAQQSAISEEPKTIEAATENQPENLPESEKNTPNLRLTDTSNEESPEKVVLPIFDPTPAYYFPTA